MEIQDNGRNNIFFDFLRYKHEILINTNEYIINSSEIIVRKVLLDIGTNEINHIIKYYQKIVLNALYLREKDILYEYNKWLYRVYYHRGIDLDFFKHLIYTFQNIVNKYIDLKNYIDINEYYKYILDKHEVLKKQATKRKLLSEHIEESTHLSKLLILGDKEKAYSFCKEKVKDLDSFLIFYNEVISNAMKNVGYLWEVGEVSVAKEHIASNTLNDIVMKILNDYPDKDKKDIHIFLSSAPQESHGQGISIASKVYEKLGYKVTNLGTSVPVKDIINAIIEFQPDYIILAATLKTSLLDVAFLIDAMVEEKAVFKKSFKIGIAGSAFDDINLPEKTFKSDFYMKKLEVLNDRTIYNTIKK